MSGNGKMAEVGKNVRSQTKYQESDKISGVIDMLGFKQNVRSRTNVNIGKKCQGLNKVSGVGAKYQELDKI